MSQVDVLALLAAAYDGNKEVRTSATQQLEAALQSPDGPVHLLTLVRAGVDPTLPPERSLAALIHAKNCVLRLMPEEFLGSVEGLAEELETVLFQGMFVVPDSHRRIICVFAQTLISAYEWNYLDVLLPYVQGYSDTVDADKALAVLQLLYTYMKRFLTPGLEPKARKVHTCASILAALPSYVQYRDFRVVRLTFKVMNCVAGTMLQLGAASGSKDLPANALDTCLQTLAAFPAANYEGAKAVGGKAYEEYVKCVKRIGVITYSLIGDATRSKKPSPVAAHFLRAHSATFYELWAQWLQTCVSTPGLDHELHMKSEMFALRYLKLCTLDERLYRETMRPQAMHLLETLFFPFLCYNGADAEIFADEDNLSEYVQYMMDEGVGNGELTPRQAASNAIVALVGGKKTFHDSTTILEELIGVLNVGLALPQTNDNFPRLFGFLQLLSILRKYIRQTPALWGQMAQVLMQHVAPCIASGFCALRCKAIVVCQRYSKVPMPSEDDFSSFIQMMCQLVNDPDARVRLAAIDAMCTVLEMKRARPYLRPFLIPLVEESLTFLNRVHTPYVPTVILHLTEHFSVELLPVMGRLGHTLVQNFLATAFDLAQQENDADGGDLSALDVARYEQVAFSSDALLDAIYTVVTACHQSPEVLQPIAGDVLLLVRRVLEEPECFDYIQKALAIFAHLVAFAKPLPTGCWELLELLFQSVESGMGVDYFVEIEEIIDNMVTLAPVEFLTNAAVMERTYAACHKMLLERVVCSPQCRCAAPQLIEVLLHQARPLAAVNPAATQLLEGTYFSRYVTLLLQALLNPDIQAEDVHIRVWVVAALMDCFYYNAMATVQVLESVGAIPQFFDHLFIFFEACLDRTKATGAAKPRKGKKGGIDVSSTAFVPQRLSALTRKVITLGLSSLLACAFDNASRAASPGLQSFAARYVVPTLELVQFCLVANTAYYEHHNEATREQLQRFCARGDDAIEDVDPTYDEVLDGDDGGGLTGDAAGEAAADGAFDEYEDVEDFDEDDDGDAARGGGGGEVEDEGDEYESPIDAVNEVELFAQVVCGPASPPDLAPDVARITGGAEALSTMAGVAAQHRQLALDFESAIQQDFSKRAGGS